MTEDQRQTKTLRSLAERVTTDFPWYARRFLRIKTKEAKIVPLNLKSVQWKIERCWNKARDEGKPLRLYILKARREGASTHTDARIFHRTTTRKNRNSLIVAHEDSTSVALFDMIRLFRDELPPQLRPMERYSSRRELVFENPNDGERKERPGLRSRLSVGTARNVDVGKGTLIHDLHCSEFAFYRDPRSFLDSIIPTVPDIPDSAIVLETTPDASGSYAHALWKAAKAGENQFTPLFLAWYDDATYVIPFASDEEEKAFEASLDADEQAARNAYHLSLDQLNWRRAEMRKYSSPAAFLNQYPENDDDCWLTAGRTVFPVDALKRQEANIKEPKWVGDLKEAEDGSIVFAPDPKGPLKIWEMPTADELPVIGADVAEGLVNGDFSCAQVLLPRSRRQIAKWTGHIDPDLFGDVLYRLGWYFGEAKIGPEVNNHGLTTITTLKKRYSNIFSRSLPNPTDPSENQEQKLGWLTNVRSKDLMEDFLVQHLREDAIVLHSVETLSELKSYVVHDDGSTGANTNSHDDEAIALMIALQVAKAGLVDPQKAAARRRKKRAILNQFSKSHDLTHTAR